MAPAVAGSVAGASRPGGRGATVSMTLLTIAGKRVVGLVASVVAGALEGGGEVVAAVVELLGASVVVGGAGVGGAVSLGAGAPFSLPPPHADTKSARAKAEPAAVLAFIVRSIPRA
jgi:hypothetical protein